jgi:hypothetical protein
MTGPRRVVFPRLRLRVAADRAYCGRCGELVGSMMSNGNVRLAPKRGHGWVYTITHPWPLSNGIWEFSLKRRRHTNPATGGPSTAVGAEADPTAIVVCPNPRCKARQVVPSR